METGTTLGPYRILAPIGAGGMGEVWKARDGRLDRDVAIKVLPAEFAADTDRLRRFEQEARVVSALNHPNILTLHDVGTHEGRPYLVTELLEGESLAERIQEGPLAPPVAMEIAQQIARGLAAAHEQGILHRDVKPGNVFLSRDGRVKLLDFGLAKQTGPASSPAGDLPTQRGSADTQAGMLLGTLGYVAPEQAKGIAADHRADIFGFGCVLYEMLAGRPAFQKETAAWSLAAIIHEEPPPLVGAGLPAGLAALVARCLAKHPDDRFPNAGQLAAALAALDHRSTGSVMEDGPALLSIVVLPFENLSPEPDNAYFADGLTDELISDLSKLGALRVISRTSAMHYKFGRKPVPAIARELNVRYVLEGSVRKAGASLRINTQLIDARSDTLLWSEKYSGTLVDVFELQEQLSRRIVEALKLTLAPEEERRLAVHAIPDPRAYDVYLRARQEIWKFSTGAIPRAQELCHQALSLAGENALLTATLAYLEFQSYNTGMALEPEVLDRGEAFADRALALSADQPVALLAKGMIRLKRRDLRGAILHLRRAATFDPTSDALAWLAYVCSISGLAAEARRHIDRAESLDPLHAVNHGVKAWIEMIDGRFEAALACGRRAMELAPGDQWTAALTGLYATYAGRDPEARELFQRALGMENGIFAKVTTLMLLALDGDRPGVADALGRGGLREHAATDEQSAWWLAALLARVGERDEALRWLDCALDLGFVHFRFFGEVDPWLAPLRGDDRFVEILHRAAARQRSFEGDPTWIQP